MTRDEETKRYGEPIPDKYRAFLGDNPGSIPLSKHDMVRAQEIAKDFAEHPEKYFPKMEEQNGQ